MKESFDKYFSNRGEHSVAKMIKPELLLILAISLLMTFEDSIRTFQIFTLVLSITYH